MALTREAIKDGFVQKLVKEAGDAVQPLSREEQEASRRAVLADVPAGQDIWIFGYGSLIWNPAFHFEEQRLGRLDGFHRRFCLRTLAGRGSEDAPGLMLALDHGGACSGVVFRIDHKKIDEETDIIWQREMIAGSYLPEWHPIATPAGEVRAIAFVINREHERYEGDLTEAETVGSLANAAGPLGRCSDYLFQTTAHLEAMGIGDPALMNLSQKVARRQGLKEPPPLSELE